MVEFTRNESVTVGATSVTISDNREPSGRTAIMVKNTSTSSQTISLALGNKTAVANEGIVLAAGDIWLDSDSESYKCFQGQIQAISSAAGGTLAIMER